MKHTFAALSKKLKAVAWCLLTGIAAPSSANIYNVTLTTDGHSTNQLRGAIEAADALGGTHTINLPAGTYNLTLGEISFGNNAQNISIVGAGSAITTINMTNTMQDRIFLINPPGTVLNVITSISGIRFTNGKLTSDANGGGALICGGPGNATTITNCAFENNSVATGAYGGGAINMQGGGSLSIDQCSFTSNNAAVSLGGAIEVFYLGQNNLAGNVSITNCLFTGNTATWSFEPSGGAVAVITQSQAAGQTFSATIQKNTFVNNSITSGSSPNGGGGAIYVESAYATNINYNRFINNTKSGVKDALRASRFMPGAVNATNNWWGCNDDPTGATSCADKAALGNSAGSGSLTTAPQLQLKTTAATSAVCQGGTTTTTVTAGFLSNSSNQAITPSDLTRLVGLPISFNVTNGSLTAAQSSIQAGGTATVTFNGNTALGASTVNAVVDQLSTSDLTARVAITVSTVPIISAHPTHVLGCPGTTANFSVTVSNVAANYQWYKGAAPLSNGPTGTGSALSGVNTATLSIANPGISDAASNYNCVVSTPCGSATSNNATLKIYGTRLYVTPTGSGDGTSWAAALGNLNSALTVASSCSGITEIWVKAGTYIPFAKPYGATTPLTRDNAFYLINGVAIYGGFAGTETLLTERNITANPTILSGDLGTVNDASDNCVHVVVSLNNNATAVLDGFTITGGNANYTAAPGVNIAGSILNRTFGGGLSLNNSSGKIQNCRFTSCNASAGGGGVFQAAGTVKITGCTFDNNSAQYGGALRNEGMPTLTVTNCLFIGNISNQSAGAMSLYQGIDTLANNLFIRNKDQGATQGGGAVCVSTGDFYIVNNTFYEDTSMGQGGAVSSETTIGSLKVHNNIFYRNYGAVSDNDIDNATTSYTQTNNSFSNVDPSFRNEGDLDGADNTWSTGDDGLRLKYGSVAANAGDNARVPSNMTNDITNGSRIQNTTVDMGAYEGQVYLSNKIFVNQAVSAGGDGITWATAFKELREATLAAAAVATIDTILVAAGSYQPAITGTANAFDISRGGIKIFGGYANDGSGNRNITANPTYLDGDIGTPGVATDNIQQIVRIHDVGAGADSIVLDGFTIRNGYTTGGGSGVAVFRVLNGYKTAIRNCTITACTTGGGAMILSNSSPYIAACSFTNNSSTIYGGGLDIINCNTPLVANCSFTGNNAYRDGGGIHASNATMLTVTNCSFTGNVSSSRGGGLAGSNSSMILTGCTFTSNIAGLDGGAAAAIYTNLYVNSCSFTGNRSSSGGGAIYYYSNNQVITVTGSTFTNDTAQYGGAIRNEGAAADRFTAVGNIFNSNVSLSGGGGAINFYSQGTDTLLNNIFLFNKDITPAGNIGGAVVLANGTSNYIVNNIFYKDTANNGGAIGIATPNVRLYNNVFYKNGSVGVPANTDISGTATAANNSFSTTNPLFFNENDPDGTDNIFGTADDGFVPVTGSPLVDAGNSNMVPAYITTDIKGALRIQGGAVDIGAYEGPVAPLPLKLLTFTGTARNGRNELAWTTAEEKDIASFDVEKSSDGHTFTSAGRVMASGNRNNTYHFTDIVSFEGDHFYRLKIYDIGGSSSYSHIVLLKAGAGSVISFLLYPNPAKTALHINATGADKELMVRIRNVAGTTIYSGTMQPVNAVINLAPFTPGVYTISIEYEGASFISKFVKEL